MIKLSEHKTALMNLQGTIEAIENIDRLIAFYSEEKQGPAYCYFEYVHGSQTTVQFKRPVMVDALTAQRSSLVSYLATLGIDATN